MNEFHGEIQADMSSMVADFEGEIQTLQASEAARDDKLQACNAKVEACNGRG